MNKILVAVAPGRSSVSAAAVYAINLAQRINFRVTFLMTAGPSHSDSAAIASSREKELQDIKVMLQDIVRRHNGGVRVDYYIGHGPYETELISFIKENRINLLVTNSPPPGKAGKQERTDTFLDSMMRIKQKTRCRIIMVSEKIRGRTVKGSITT